MPICPFAETLKKTAMTAIILTAHTLIVLGLIVVVLLQRSDGAALGIGGGGGGGGGFMTGRGAANALTRTTSVLAAGFFATSLALAVLAGSGENDDSIIEGLTGEAAPTFTDPADMSTDDLLGTLGADDDGIAPAAGDEAPADLDAVLDSLGTEEDPAPAPSDEGADESDNDEETPQ